MKEIWKRMPGFREYEISNIGRIRSWKRAHKLGKPPKFPTLLHPCLDNHGYHKIKLYKNAQYKNFAVGECVLFAFRGPRPYKFEMSHIDGNKANNSLENLLWESRKANSDRIDQMGRRVIGANHPNSKLNSRDVLRIINLAEKEIPDRKISEKFGVSRTCIYKIRSGINWKHITR